MSDFCDTATTGPNHVFALLAPKALLRKAFRGEEATTKEFLDAASEADYDEFLVKSKEYSPEPVVRVFNHGLDSLWDSVGISLAEISQMDEFFNTMGERFPNGCYPSEVVEALFDAYKHDPMLMFMAGFGYAKFASIQFMRGNGP